MRVTIGGLLLFGGTSTFAVLGSLSKVNFDLLHSPVQSMQKSVSGLTTLFKGGEAPSPVPIAPSEEPAAKPAAPVAAEPVQPAAPVAAPETKPEPVAEAPAPAVPVVEEVKPAAKPAHRKHLRRRHLRKKAARPAKAAVPSAAKPAPAKPAEAPKAAAGSIDNLMDTYVSLKLKSGRDVKGILREKTSTQYTIELPGMGPFQYAVENVVSVTAAE